MYVPSDLRQLVLNRSGGCCEYCRIPSSGSSITFHIEHIIAVSHGGVTSEENLAYSCSRFNLRKGSNIAAADPASGAPTFLFHPRNHHWDDHFRLSGAVIEPLTAEGRATVFVLRLNDADRIEQRELLVELGDYPCEKSSSGFPL